MKSKPKSPPANFPLTTDTRTAAFTAARLGGDEPRKALLAAVEAHFREVMEEVGCSLKREMWRVDDKYEFGYQCKNRSAGAVRWSIVIKPVFKKVGEFNHMAKRGSTFIQNTKTGEFNWDRIRNKIIEMFNWMAEDQAAEREAKETGRNDPARIRRTLRDEFKYDKVDEEETADGKAVLLVPVATVGEARVAVQWLKKLGILPK